MRIQNSLFLALASYCFAAQYSVDVSCRTTTQLFDGVKGAIQEGLDLAANALTVMTDHAEDPWVKKMAQYVLGTVDYDAKFAQAKITFAAVNAYQREPSPLQPLEAAWKSTRSNMDVEIYCDESRATLPEGAKFWVDGAMGKRILPNDKKTFDLCYKKDFVPGSGVQAPKAITLSSDLFDRSAWAAALLLDSNVQKTDYKTKKPNIACTMDLCTWFTAKALSDGWPTITADRVNECKTDEFKAGLATGPPGLTPIDGLKTFGSTMLHELTHTNQGGLLIDVPEDQRPEDVNSCYNWLCIGGLKNVRNADSIAMLGMAMKLWTLNHYADDDGTIHPIT